MSKNELRIKLLILGLLFITAFLIIVLIYLSPASLQNNQLSMQNDDEEKVNNNLIKTEDTNYKKTQQDSLSKNDNETIKETTAENIAIASAKTYSSNKTISTKKEKKILYFIIDDTGYSLENIKPFLDFPGDITIAVLPGLVYSKQCAELALKKGKKVILHQPMESIKGNNPGPYSIKSGMPENEIIEILEHNINSIPGILGMNNHMGSAITIDERIMKIILQYLYNKDLFFIDSMTTHDSICRKVALDIGFDIMHRDVFLDNINEKKAIMDSIDIGKAIAENKGYAVMIGHTWSSELANTMMQIYPDLILEGFTIKDTSAFPMGDNYFESTGN